MAFGLPACFRPEHVGRMVGDAGRFATGNDPAILPSTSPTCSTTAARSALGEAGRTRFLEHLSWDTQAKSLLRAYDHVLAQRRGRNPPGERSRPRGPRHCLSQGPGRRSNLRRLPWWRGRLRRHRPASPLHCPSLAGVRLPLLRQGPRQLRPLPPPDAAGLPPLRLVLAGQAFSGPDWPRASAYGRQRQRRPQTGLPSSRQARRPAHRAAYSRLGDGGILQQACRPSCAARWPSRCAAPTASSPSALLGGTSWSAGRPRGRAGAVLPNAVPAPQKARCPWRSRALAGSSSSAGSVSARARRSC